ncbi:MAG: glycogen-binding domain-containing protein [Candidatus Caldatribacteriaceae bacterium]
MDRKEEQLIRYLHSLPRQEVSAGFAGRVMEEVHRRSRPYVFFKKWVVVALAGAFLCFMFFTSLPIFPRLEISRYLGYRKIELVFYSPTQNPRTVAVAGDFSDWNYLDMEKGQGNSWRITIRLRPGKYEYGFLVDGKEWVPDPNAPRQIADGFGNLNSVLVVDGLNGE